MNRVNMWMILFVAGGIIVANLFSAYPQDEQTVAGAIEQIAEDGTFIIVAGKRITTTPEFLEENYLEEGELIEAEVKDTPQGLAIVDYQYLYDDSDYMDEAG